jgi:hypothetical protein
MDCCFAAAAVAKLQGPLNEVVQQKTFEAFPGKGTSLLCASSAHDFASAPPELEYSVFSGSLLSVLRIGNPEIETSLSLYQIGRMGITFEQTILRIGLFLRSTLQVKQKVKSQAYLYSQTGPIDRAHSPIK